MKKIYSLFTALLSSMLISLGVSAEDGIYTITLDIDNPDAVVVKVATSVLDSGTVQEITKGENKFQMSTGYVSVTEVSPYKFKAVTDAGTGVDEFFYGNKWQKNFSESVDGKKYIISTYNLNDTRTATVEVVVDNASKIYCNRTGTYAVVDLSDGTNTVKYDPENETALCFSNYVTTFYKVTADGKEIESENDNSAYYTINLVDNSNNPCVQKIEVITEFPDEDYIVTFSYPGEKGSDVLSSVKIDNVEVSEFDGVTLAVKGGQTVSLMPADGLVIDELKINGSPATWYKYGKYYNEYTFTVTGDTNVSISAHEYGTVKGRVIVDNPENMIFMLGTGSSVKVLDLKPGEEVEFELSENDNTVTWKAADGCYLASIKINGEIPTHQDILTGEIIEYDPKVYNVKNGDLFEFEAKKIEYDKTVALWVDKRYANDDLNYTSYLKLERQDYSEVNVPLSGYETVEFWDGDNNFCVYWYDTYNRYDNASLYINDQLQTPLYGATYNLTLNDGDVVKFFMTTIPVSSNVYIEVEDGIEPVVVKDMIVPITDFNNPITVFNGTEFTIILVDNESYVVKVNDSVLDAAEGVYSVTIDGDTKIAVSKVSTEDPVGTGALFDENAQNVNIYTFNGVKLSNGITVKSLPAGLYIINDKKVIIH